MGGFSRCTKIKEEEGEGKKRQYREHVSVGETNEQTREKTVIP